MNADELDAAATALTGPVDEAALATAMTRAVELLQRAAHERHALNRWELSVATSGSLMLTCRNCRRRREGISPGITLSALLRNTAGICDPLCDDHTTHGA